jgi:hypothetical protein
MLYALCNTMLQGRPVCSRGPAERQTEALHAGQLSTPLPDALPLPVRRAYFLLIQRREYFPGSIFRFICPYSTLALQGSAFWLLFCKCFFPLLASQAMNWLSAIRSRVFEGTGTRD